MSRYLKAEFFRIRKSKSALISLFLIPAFILINFVIGYKNGNVVMTTNQPIGSDFIMIIGEALQAFIPFILIIPIYATINKEINEHGMEKALESGIRPVSIYLSKFISIVIIGIIYSIAMAIVISIIPMTMGYSFNDCLNILENIFKVISIEFIPILSLISIYLLLIFVFKNEVISLITYIILIGPIDKILLFMEKITRIKNLSLISNYIPNKLMYKLQLVFDFKETTSLFGREMAAIPSVYIICTVYTIVLLGIGITLFSKRKVEGI